MRTASKSQGKAMYVASPSDSDGLLNVQQKLYTRSKNSPDYVFRKLWGFVTDLHTLRVAFARVAGNRGKRTAGVDGLTVRTILSQGMEIFVAQLRAELRSGAYRPSPVRRVLIPKAGQPGKFRPLGIPTVKDRVVQAAVKLILEPIFEPDFFPVSYGFRPGKSVHGALEHLRMLLRPRIAGAEGMRRLPYQWAVEGDIKGCFDNIDHHALMVRIRRRVGDSKVNRMVVAFLKAGVLAEEQFLRSDNGTPQGGILSPLLSNIALSAIEERYERHVWPRRTPTLLTTAAAIVERAKHARVRDRANGRVVVFPIRYADDFLLLVGAPPGPGQHDRARDAALQEKASLAVFLKEHLNLELSEAKTLVTPVTKPMRFLGHHVRVRSHPTHGRWVSTAVVPRERSDRFRKRIKDLFRRCTTGASLEARLQKLNPILRGWASFYRHAWGAKRVFDTLDNYVWWTIFRWLKKKHARVPAARLWARYACRNPGGWRDGSTVLFRMARTRVGWFKLGWLKPPAFALSIDGEPGA
jgi:RNA-directed DNA polymerase